MINKVCNFSCLQLWQCRVADNTTEIEASTLTLLSQSERLRYQRTKSVKKRREYLLSRALIRFALSQLFCQPATYWSLTENPGSPPIINNLPTPLFYSLSHSKGYICFVMSDYPVGVDVQKIQNKNNLIELAEVFMNDAELALFMDYTPATKVTYFYKIWSAKEAYLKAIPKEQQSHLKLNSSDILPTISAAKNWSLIDKSSEEFSLVIIVNCLTENIQINQMPV